MMLLLDEIVEENESRYYVNAVCVEPRRGNEC